MQLRNGARWLSLTTLTGIGAMMGSNAAFAAGFALRNESTSGMGNGLSSNTVNTYDASGLASNPAIMSEFKTQNISINVNRTMANIKAKDASLSLPTGAAHPRQGESSRDDVSSPVTIPYLFGIHPINEQVAVGWSVTVPYGTNTDYDNNWAGRYHATKTELQTLDLTLHGSYKVNDLFTAGLSIGYEQAKGELAAQTDLGLAFYTAQTQANGALGTPNPALIGQRDVKSTFTGDSTAVTFGLGFLVKPTEVSRIGLSYKAPVKQKAKGDLKWDPTSADARTIYNGLIAAGQTKLNDSSDASLELELPSVISLGYAHNIADFTVYGNVTQTTWSSFENLDVKWASFQSRTELNWNDSTFFAIGGDYRLDPMLTFRAGVGFDKSVVGDKDRTPRTPDNDRTILSLGGSYKTEKWSADLGIQKLFIEETKIDLKANSYADNNARGDLKAKLEIDPLIVMLGGSYNF
jgi:long-chain fatty acid transport protein